MNLIIRILLALFPLLTSAQNADFHFKYSKVGMGANVFSFEPTLEIDDHSFSYNLEQNSYWGVRDEHKKFIAKGMIQQGAIDSIHLVVQGLRDSIIDRFNPCLSSGYTICITVVFGTDTTSFILNNTFDYSALQIIAILNPYLPKNKPLFGSEKAIKEEEDCYERLGLRNNEEKEIKN